MAPLLFKEMKGVNFSCVSPASAAVCSSIDRRSMVRPAIVARSVDRRPKPYSDKSRESLDHRLSTRASTRSRTSISDLMSPANSARFLLDDTAFFDVYPVFEPPPPSLELMPADVKPKSSSSSSSSAGTPRILKPMMKDNESPSIVARRSSVSSARHSEAWTKSQHVLRQSNSTGSHHDQVVVLRVSLHCKGCEGKVRKHISKMEGVTSFNIDFAAKKVTVKGDVTPLGVLSSVSKVKNAQFWPSPPRAPASV